MDMSENGVDELITRLANLGAHLELDGQALRVRAPHGALTPELQAAIRQHKGDVIERLVQLDASRRAAQLPQITPDTARRHDAFPLNSVQYAYWIGQQLSTALGGVSTHIYFEIDACNLDLNRLETALNSLIRHHDMLRVIITPEGMQQILSSTPHYVIQLHDLRGESAAGRATFLESLRAEESTRVTKCDVWPLFRVLAVRLTDITTRLILSWNFIAIDAASLLLIFRQWHALYEGSTDKLSALTLSFRDVVLHQAAMQALPRCEDARAYWWKRIDHLPGPPQLPLIEKWAETRRPSFKRRSVRLEPDVWRGLKERVKQAGLTPSCLLLASFVEVLRRWSSSENFCLMLTVFNRPPVHAEINELVGDFTNLVLFEVGEGRQPTFIQRAQSLQTQMLRDLDHSDISAVEVIRERAHRVRDQQSRLFPIVFTSTLGSDTAARDAGVLGCFGPVIWGISQTPQTVLDCQIFEIDGALVLNWDAVESVFLPGVLEEMFSSHTVLLNTLANDAAALDADTVAEIPPAQQEQRSRYNDSGPAVSSGELLHSGVIAQALSRPHRIAIRSVRKNLTYGELLARSVELGELIRERDPHRSRIIAVVLEKGWEQPVAVLAALLAGSAYLPIDPGWPAARRSQILRRVGARVAITSARLHRDLEWPEGLELLCVTEDFTARPVTVAPATPQQPHDLAYVIFTSGSTGVPKGVMIDHRGAVNTLHHVNSLFGLTETDSILGLAELTFDLSVYDIFGVLAVGGTLVLPEANQARNPAHWLQLIRDTNVTVWNSAPQLMELLVRHAEAQPHADLGALRLVLMSGDWIPLRLPPAIRALQPGARIVSLGGATEGSIWSIYHPIGEIDPLWQSIPYGRPLPGQHMYVMSAGMRDCPDLVPGQIFIGGAGVALGYFGDEEQSRARFVRRPQTGERLYATGDLGRFRRDGTIEFLGRNDSQVKLRGFRIELTEVSAALQALPGVRQALARVLVRDDRQLLIAYVVMDKEGADVESALRQQLAQTLPGYMVPQRIVTVKHLPLTAHGKVDLTALPAVPDRAPAPEVTDRARSATEQRVLDVWRKVLRSESVGVDQNFFEAGGDSMLLIEVLRHLNAYAPTSLTAADLFSHPTVASLARYMEHAAERPVEPINDASATAPVPGISSIAIIGMAGRFPDAANCEELWRNIARGHCSIRRFTKEELARAGVPASEANHPGYVAAGSVLAGKDLFDAEYFGVAPSEAELLDPQQRLLLECAAEALEHSGYPTEANAGRIGVFAAKGLSLYLINHILGRADVVDRVGLFEILNAHEKDHVATYVSYRLNLTGPSLSINTACSSALVAVHMACQSLRNGECEIALAGGVSFSTTRELAGYRCEQGHITSPDGVCRAFSDDANGTVFGSGVGLVVLKPLEAALRDHDTIHAVILGSAINNDGSTKVGYTAPSAVGQAQAISRAYLNAGVDPRSVEYIETHGTGTPLGDPIEIAALNEVFGRSAPKHRIALGSLKSNIGHLDAAAGIAGLIKATMALRQKEIPPAIHAHPLNSRVPFHEMPFVLPTERQPWLRADHPRRAGVSSFGVGGTNAHAVLEEAPDRPARAPSQQTQLVVLSARSLSALRRVREQLADALERPDPPDLADTAYTLQVGRRHWRYRLTYVTSGARQLAERLRKPREPSALKAENPTLAFMFSGQGSLDFGAAKRLYFANPVFRDAFDRCARAVAEVSPVDIQDALTRSGPHAGAEGHSEHGTAITQPLIVAIELALSSYWASLGIEPQAMIGHSLGEYAAACLAGVFSLEEAMAAVAIRGRLIQSLPPGQMLAVLAPVAQAGALVSAANCDLAAINGPQQCTAAGEPAAIEALQRMLHRERIDSRVLQTSHAFHSRMMDPVLDIFERALSQLDLKRPSTPFVSTVTGTWCDSDEVVRAGYWARHIRSTVQFEAGVSALRERAAILLEVGPGRVLTALARSCGVPRSDCLPSFTDDPAHVHDPESTLVTLGDLWSRGVSVRWEGLHRDRDVGRIPLPTYPFERRRYWIDPSPQVAAPGSAVPPAAASYESSTDAMEESHPRPELTATYVAPRSAIEQQISSLFAEQLGISRVGIDDNFFELGGDSLMATRIYSRLRKDFQVTIPMAKVFSLATVRRLALLVRASQDVNALNEMTSEEIDEISRVLES